ncbi:MAG: glycosyltransferase [Burkholderiales bacterium]|nr:glycosyltransferase [Burkholderiales bacterium]
MASSLQVILPTYYPLEDDLVRSLHALANAIEFARHDGVINSVNVALVDNSQDSECLHRMVDLAQLFFRDPIEVSFLSGHNNMGIGSAINLALHGSGADYHLILLVNVELQRDAIAEGVSWMQANEDAGLATAALFDQEGHLKSPCYRYPTVWDALLLYLAPAFVKRLLARRFDRFRMFDEIQKQETFFDIPCFKSSCMLARRTITDQTGGFDPSFFIYFSSWDLSLRLGLITRTVYLPQMRALTYPSLQSLDSGWSYPSAFLRDAVKFFRKHHCRWW